MTEPILTEPNPFWEDWRLWQIITTSVFAFLGFAFGTWIKYRLDLRRDDRLRRQETEGLMKALASEMQAIASTARIRVQTLNQFVHNPLPSVLQVLEPSRAPVFERNADKIGWIPDAPRDQIFAAIIAREAVEAVIHMYVILTWASGRKVAVRDNMPVDPGGARCYSLCRRL